MTRTENFLSQNFFQVFLKTTFFYDSCHPDHYEPKIFFSIFEIRTYPSIHDFGLEGPLVMRSRKAGLPFATRAWKRELSIQEVRIENDSDRKFSKSNFFPRFSEKHFFLRFMLSSYPDHYEPKIFIFRSGVRTYKLNSGGCRTKCDWFQILKENVTFGFQI